MESETKKALFYITGKNVQHIGCRLVITRELIHRGFKKGGAFNLPDGRVEVVLEGTEKQLETFRKDVDENLMGWLDKYVEDRDILTKEMFEKIKNPGIHVSPKLEYSDELLVLDIGLFSHSLTFDQVYKGIDVYKELKDAINKLSNTLDKQINKK